MKKQNKLYLIRFILVITLLMINFIRAEMLVSDTGVEYEEELVDYFNNQTLVQELIFQSLSHSSSLQIVNNETWVSVIIYLKDPSYINSLISDFSEDKLKNVVNRQIPDKSSPEKIGAEITKQAFDKLIQDPRINKIYYSHPMYLLNERDLTKKVYVILSILGVFILFIVIIYIIRKKFKNKKRK